MFHLYTGNRLEDLSSILARILSLSLPESPFAKEHILVQSPGMAQWLKMQLAQEQGVAAGYEFPLPSTFVWRCFQQALQDIPGQSEFNKPFLVWRLMRLLDNRLEEAEFQQLAWYLAEDDSQLRRFQLCSSIADIYDQYLVYRPDWIAAWEEGNQAKDLPKSKDQDQAWQSILWRDLVADVASYDQSLYHRANLLEALEEVVRSKPKPPAIPQRVYIFGVSALPPNTLQSLRLLAESNWIDMHLFLQNPCQYYWGDIVDKNYLGRVLNKQANKPGLNQDTLHLDANPLLASWGRLGRDYIGELQAFANQQLEVFESYCDDDSQASLLNRIQQDVLELNNHGALEERSLASSDSHYKYPIANDDNSVAVQVCHSSLREVEVLHDSLLALFEKDPHLTPKDVIVMLPDVNQYSPFVQAVFGQAPQQQSIPYSLIDQAAGMENPVVDAYVTLLSLADSRFTLSELVSVLEVPAVLARFGIQVHQVERIRQWCSEVGIRWGLDESTATDLDLPSQAHNTWQNGLDRMLLGYAMGNDNIWQSLLSYGEVEGLEAELAGQLAAFLDAIRETQQALLLEKKPNEWVSFLYQVSERFFTLDEDDAFPPMLSKHMEAICDEWQHAQFDQTIDVNVLKQLLIPRLQEAQGSQRFLAGKVNFCTLMPMRSVPFKVVCLLGLNEGAYPRSMVPMGFDLMVGDYRSGDRSRREDDKYLFLEALMSAREHLYISYVGRSVKDNSELNPSILVSELVDYIAQSCVLEKDMQAPVEEGQAALLEKLVQQHKLQPFHQGYYSNKETFSGQLKSYDASWLDAVNVTKQKTEQQTLPLLLAIEDQQHQLELNQLMRFYLNPARYFMQHRLKAYLKLQEIEENEDEPFNLDALTRYQLKEELLLAIQEDTLESFIAKLKLSGKYPYGAFGDMEVNDLVKQSRIMALNINEYAHQKLDAINIDLQLEQGRVQSWLELTNRQLYLVYHLGQLSPGKKIQAWLSHLALCAQGEEIETHILSFKNAKSNQVITHVFEALSVESATDYLSQYLTYFRLGDRQPLVIPARTSDAWCAAYLNDKNQDNEEEAAWQMALKTYNDDFNDFSDGKDPYWQRFFADLALYQNDFVEYVKATWLPMNELLKVKTDEQ
ncbi:exodeoxyribonuclease V subunit gamma [Marinomonas sp. PE14-40]|uniref:exodeoxyribonuclease V subunit gamma n=1 Tax=Marinomonas sp. PE14-40 TaxID=3060621 RepID=UPI003F67298D